MNELFSSHSKQVIFYPTYAYEKDDAWVMPLRLRVALPRAWVEFLLTQLTGFFDKINAQEKQNFRQRIKDFVANSESRERVQFCFDQDAENLRYQMQDEAGDALATNLNGFCASSIHLLKSQAEKLLQAQTAQTNWLTFRAVSPNHVGAGRVRLLGAQGLSVISDIDDTIKITDVLAGKRAVVRNTFFSDFRAVPMMAKKYQSYHEAAFHYVSGSPWQLQPVLENFLVTLAGFPAGSWHLREMTKNPASLTTWAHWKDLIVNEEATFEQKIRQITAILQHFPQRKFILMGDSGERDREVYAKMQQDFCAQVQEIFIRDVTTGTLNRL